jgi:microcystin-dependent protein
MPNALAYIRTTGLYIIVPLSVAWTVTALPGLAAWAASTGVSVPNTFSSGQVVSSAQMNANFQTLVDAVNALNSATVPSGTVIAFAGTSVPAGWLLCDGSAVSRTQYAALFTALAISHGGGDGINTFNIPDYRGRFLRGVDANSGHDPDAASRVAPQPTNSVGAGNTGDQIGSLQLDAFQGHHHMVTGYNSNGTIGPIPLDVASGSVDDPASFAFADDTAGQGLPSMGTGNYFQARDYTVDGANGTPRAASETRPANAYVQYIIKT